MCGVAHTPVYAHRDQKGASGVFHSASSSETGPLHEFKVHVSAKLEASKLEQASCLCHISSGVTDVCGKLQLVKQMLEFELHSS